MEKIQKCMLLSQKAYKGKYGKTNIDKEITGVTWYTDIEFYTCYDSQNNLYIVFKGSSGLRDWIDNLDFLFKKDGKFKIHSGHLEQFKKVKNEIFALVAEHHINYQTKIYVTGHSLGGSLAHITGLMLVRHFPYLTNFLHIYSYGANKCFNYKTVKWYNKHVQYSTRVVNNDDIVPKLPPKTSLFGLFKNMSFFHVKNKVRIGKKQPWWYIFRIFKNIKGDIKSHYPQEYVKNLTRAGLEPASS